MNNINTNVDNYSIPELLTILDLEDPTEDNVTEITDKYIQQFTETNNITMADFFQDIQDTLLEYLNELDQYKEGDQEANDNLNSIPWQNISNQPDPVQNNKITDRVQKIDVYNNTHLPMGRQQLGVSNTINLPVAQDKLNPNLKNTYNRILNLDSQYMQSSGANDSSTDYTLDLSEPLLNVLSIRLYSYQIPYTWYTFDTTYGNTCFWVTFYSSGVIQKSVRITIPSGNYSTTTLPNAFINALSNAGFSNFANVYTDPASGSTTTNPIYISSVTGKVTLNLYGATYSSYSVDTTTIITFFDPTGTTFQDASGITCSSGCSNTMAINQSLGWIIGFRLPYVYVEQTGNTGAAIANFYGPKYLILSIDDFNQNHINNGLVGIGEVSKNIKLPSYYSPDMPFQCTKANDITSNLVSNTTALANDVNAGTLLMDKLNTSYVDEKTILPTAPRTLTQSQIYAINEIIKNNDKTYNYKLTAPTTTDTFAVIPIKHSTGSVGDTIVEFGGSLQDNKRVYFGPVNIERLRMRLLDDKGNILNLNGGDWSVTIICELLYQY
jgi:hypothetical protein